MIKTIKLIVSVISVITCILGFFLMIIFNEDLNVPGMSVGDYSAVIFIFTLAPALMGGLHLYFIKNPPLTKEERRVNENLISPQEKRRTERTKPQKNTTPLNYEVENNPNVREKTNETK